MIYKIINTQLRGNEHGELKSNVIYAELVDEFGILVISSTLEYILIAIRDRGYNVENVTVTPLNECTYKRKTSIVKLDLY